MTPSPISSCRRSATAATAASSARSTRSRSAFHATARYIAPVSMCRYCETCRDGTRDRALAGARGSVDGDDRGPLRSTTAIILAMRRSRTAALTFVAVALVLAPGGFVAEYARGAAFVARAAGATGFVRSVADWRRQPVTESSIEIAWRGGFLRGRLYRPARATGRPLLLVPGVHASGIDEPRLIGFARDLGVHGSHDGDCGVVGPRPLQRHPPDYRT